MKTFTIDGVEYSVPEISFDLVDDKIIFKIEEGEHAGIVFSIKDMRMDDTDEGLMWYDLETVEEKHVQLIKSTVDNFILMTLHNEVEKIKNLGDKDDVQTEPSGPQS